MFYVYGHKIGGVVSISYVLRVRVTSAEPLAKTRTTHALRTPCERVAALSPRGAAAMTDGAFHCVIEELFTYEENLIRLRFLPPPRDTLAYEQPAAWRAGAEPGAGVDGGSGRSRG